MTESLRSPKVLLISHGFQEAYERGFTNALAYLGATVELVSSDRTNNAHIDARVGLLNLRGSQDESRNVFQKALNIVRYHLVLLALALGRRDAILHVIGTLDFPVFCGIFEGLFFRAVLRRYVLTVHDLLPHDRHNPWNQLICALIYRIPTALIVHTETMKEQLVARFRIPCDKIFVMEHGCEMQTNGLHDEVPVMRPQRRKEGFGLLFFGQIEPYKGLDLLLKAFDQLERYFYLNIVGRCRDRAYAHRVEEMIAESLARERIAWRNEYVSEQDMATVFLNADALVLPYRHIDQSGALFQAFRFGIPLVVSRVGEFERYVSKDYGEVFTAGNVDDLVTALQRLYRRKSEISREKIIHRGSELDWRKTVEALKPVYWYSKQS